MLFLIDVKYRKKEILMQKKTVSYGSVKVRSRAKDFESAGKAFLQSMNDF